MASLGNLHRAVQAAIAAKRIGKVVFVRYILQGVELPETTCPQLAVVAANIREWVGSPIDRIYGLTGEGGQIALTVKFRDGATALLNFVHGSLRGDGVDLLVLGNRGAIYHDSGLAHLWDAEKVTAEEKPNPALQAAIERALLSGKPEPLGKEAQP